MMQNLQTLVFVIVVSLIHAFNVNRVGCPYGYIQRNGWYDDIYKPVCCKKVTGNCNPGYYVKICNNDYGEDQCQPCAVQTWLFDETNSDNVQLCQHYNRSQGNVTEHSFTKTDSWKEVRWVITAVAAIGLMVIVVAVLLLYWRKRRRSNNDPEIHEAVGKKTSPKLLSDSGISMTSFSSWRQEQQLVNGNEASTESLNNFTGMASPYRHDDVGHQTECLPLIVANLNMEVVQDTSPQSEAANLLKSPVESIDSE